MDEKRVADYFIISGVSENAEHNTESKPLINSVLPITDITVIIKSLGEQCPIGYTCIEYTPGGHIADLNNGNFKSPNIHICYRRGNDKPPLVEVGVYHQDKDRVLPDVEVVHETPYGRSASTGNSTHKSGTYITYRRAKTKCPYNQLVVVDLCVILNNKSEHPPHAFYSIKKNLNKSYYGMIGSEVFLCYKKTLLSPPSICYTPQIISRFPLKDLANFPLPDTVPLFCLPAGASIESRPSNLPLPRPVASTFVLTSDSAQKIYGSALSFYEPYDELLLTPEQRARLNVCQTEDETEQINQYETYAIKSICILSRWPFFECFERFLSFLHKLVFNPYYSSGGPNSPTHSSNIPLEHHISHFLLDVSFPTPQRPTVIVQLKPGTDETVTISQPSSKLPLPLTGASFIHLLTTLGVENTMNVLLFGLCEQKILLHSLNPWLLTSVAEAITAILFPFHWQCPYVPLCPLSLHGILNAPLPFIVGIDSRCFDTFTPPDDVICVDLDTRSIFLSELKKCLNIRILPKRASRVLRNSLDDIFQKWMRVSQAIGVNQSPQHKTPTMEASRQQLKRKFELEIQEAFVRFMATILKGFRSYLLPITRAPTVGATDPTSLFDFDGFLMSRERNYSQFYLLITKTQLFTHYIEERSFVSDKDTSLAFFDDCEEKLSSSDDVFSGKPIKLFDKDDEIIRTDRSVYIPAPEQSPSVSHNNSVAETEPQVINIRRLKFGPLNPALFHRHPQSNSFPSLDRALKLEQAKNQSIFDDATKAPNNSFSISRRTKQEVEASHRRARKSAKSPSEWSKYLVSCCYCLWFSLLPSYIAFCKNLTTEQEGSTSDLQTDQDKTTARILRYAYSAIVRMQRIQLTTDEVCFRILTLLCGHCGQPALAVRVFFEMRKAGIKPNAITYGYYNTALLESKWPDHSGKPTTILWTKIKNVIMGIALFKFHGRIRMGRRDKCSMPLIGAGDMSFGHVGVVGRASTPKVCSDDLFRPTTVPIDRDIGGEINYKMMNRHRRSLVDRSFSTFQKSTMDVDKFNNMSSVDSHGGRRGGIRKSNSMHARSISPETGLLSRSSSLGDDDQHQDFAQDQIVSGKKSTLTQDTLSTVEEKQQTVSSVEPERTVIESVNLVLESSAAHAFTTKPNSSRKLSRSASQSFLSEDVIGNNVKLNGRGGTQNDKSYADNVTNVDSFDERDLQCTASMEMHCERKPNLSHSVNYLRADDASSEGARSNRLSDSITDTSTGNPSNDIEFNSMDDVLSTPNFKLSSLINDASNLQWSKWTSSQNSKSVYKGIKSVATGLVSSLQEIKSSFSMSNTTTPAKLITAVQQKSTTREMLSQWATQWGYFLSQTTKVEEDDSDNDSATSGDLLNLVDDDNIEQTSAETNDFQFYHRILIESERQYNSTNSIEDLVCHLSSFENVDEDQIAIVIKLTTCNRCNGCHSLLNDEEIMGRWSYNESNLNTRCVYCQAKIVPQMTVEIEDRRFRSTSVSDESTAAIAHDLLNLEDDQSKENNKQQECTTPASEEAKDDSKVTESVQKNHAAVWCLQTFTVPYLSPIVLRKELESVFESSGDSCPATSHFIDEHPIIFWNLLWYFARVAIPTHLALLCLTSKSILNGKEGPDETSSRNKVIVQTLLDGE